MGTGWAALLPDAFRLVTRTALVAGTRVACPQFMRRRFPGDTHRPLQEGALARLPAPGRQGAVLLLQALAEGGPLTNCFCRRWGFGLLHAAWALSYSQGAVLLHLRASSWVPVPTAKHTATLLPVHGTWKIACALL